MLEFFWIKLLAFKPATLLKRNSKITRCFSVNISEFLKIPILKKFCERLLQNNVKPNWCSCKCFSKFARENLCQNVLFNKPIFIQKEVPELVFSWQLPEVFNNNFFKSIVIKKKIFFKNACIRYIANLITQTSPRFLYSHTVHDGSRLYIALSVEKKNTKSSK